MRLLLIEPNADHAELTVAALRHFGLGFEYTRVESLAGLRAEVDSALYSAVIAEYELPGFTAAGALEIVRGAHDDLPFLVVSATLGEERVVEMIRAGANDCISKDGLARLGAALARELRDVQLRQERRELFHALRRSEERYRRIFENAPIGIAVSTAAGPFITVNDRFVSLVGRARREILGAHPSQLGFALDDAEPAEAGGLPRWDVEIAHADGSVASVTVTVAAIAGDDGATAQLVWLAEDVTEASRAEIERKRLSGKLDQANRVSSLGRLAATIAHEFNNVLMGIAPFVEIIRRGKNVDIALDHIGRSVKRGKRITEDILRFTQPAEPVRAPFDAASWVENMIVEARSLLPQSCAIGWSSEPRLRIDGDAGQLQQVLMNLILNARDAMPSGGTIIISARREPPGARMPFGFVAHVERFVHLTIADSGGGMSPETLQQMFEPLFTTKKNGTGLGLPVVHQVIQRHGGEIFVESHVGSGTTFHIFLPLSEADLQPAKTHPPVALAGKPRILLVEDEPAVAAGVVALLEIEGLSVEVATTGADAIRAAADMSPDVVVLDVGLPDMDGMSVYTAISQRGNGVPVIFSTGHADRSKIDDLDRLPNVTYLMKPYESATLLAAIRRVMTAGVPMNDILEGLMAG